MLKSTARSTCCQLLSRGCTRASSSGKPGYTCGGRRVRTAAEAKTVRPENAADVVEYGVAQILEHPLWL